MTPPYLRKPAHIRPNLPWYSVSPMGEDRQCLIFRFCIICRNVKISRFLVQRAPYGRPHVRQVRNEIIRALIFIQDEITLLCESPYRL